MLRRLLLCLCLFMFLSAATCVAVERSPVLDAAFQMLEKDNIFQRRYNELTGAEVVSLFETGLPYFFGGRPTKLLMSRYPEFAKRDCWEDTGYYKQKKVYVYGLDCMGYVTWLRKEAGLPKMPSMGDILNDLRYRKYDLFCGGWNWKYAETPLPAPETLKDVLRVGDMLIMRTKYRHIMLYIGTLRDYGFNAENEPSVADWLDYPLVIHCGPNPRYPEAIQAYIDAHPDYCHNCLTTDGGVGVSLLYVPGEAAPYHEHVQVTDFDYFLIDDGRCVLTIRPTENPRAYCWVRLD